jgi:hypothetical protein
MRPTFATVRERSIISEEYLVWLNLSLLEEKPGRKEDGDAFFKMHHYACG